MAAAAITTADVCTVEDVLRELEVVFDSIATRRGVDVENQSYAMGRLYTVKHMVADLVEYMQMEENV